MHMNLRIINKILPDPVVLKHIQSYNNKYQFVAKKNILTQLLPKYHRVICYQTDKFAVCVRKSTPGLRTDSDCIVKPLNSNELDLVDLFRWTMLCQIYERYTPGIVIEGDLRKGGTLTGVIWWWDEILDPYAGAIGSDFILMDDNAQHYRAVIVEEYLDGLVWSEWNSQLDLRLKAIEYLWDNLGR
ncbi:HTH_Tnp_Tc3_2 domain-containing protein [Trichonephila clavipes]|nr:HTH_Tnp_Tc3_2 domain-containing protein [Trichonephila clavipes]